MGRDKALLNLEGRPLIEHMVEKLRGLGMTARICGSRRDLAGFGEIVTDNFEQAGPLAGIEAALIISGAEMNLFVPVDLPGLSAEFLRWLMARAETSGAVATIPRYGDREQPLCAVYSRRLVEGMGDALHAGRRKVMDGVRGAAAGLGESIDTFDVECVAAAGCVEEDLRLPASANSGPMRGTRDLRPGEWFRNVNTPEDYEAVRMFAGAKDRHPIS
jgi:molybdopterin-guanine dinucleotide biosynthesis protein A